MNALLAQMMRIAAEAADEVMRVYERPFEVELKGPNDPVTKADRIANELICTRLRAAYPDIPIVAEESPEESWAHYRASEKVFFVDPVDGTKEFVRKSGQFAVMIGLLDGDHPTHGVLHAPAQQTIWAGVAGEGAFRIDKKGERHSLPPIQSRALSECRVASSRSQQTELNRRALDALSPREIVPMGSAGLKGTALCDAEVDIYLAPKYAGCLWDSCAPEALIRALGGVFTDIQGEPIDYRSTTVENNRGAVAAAPELHAQVLDRLSLLFR